MNNITDSEEALITAFTRGASFIVLTNEYGALNPLARAPFKFEDITYHTVLNALIAKHTPNEQMKIDIAHFDFTKLHSKDILKLYPTKERHLLNMHSRTSHLFDGSVRGVRIRRNYVSAVYSIIRAKLSQYPELKMFLRKTGSCDLIYYNRRGDADLGCCLGEGPNGSHIRGMNVYGKVLMVYRAELTGRPNALNEYIDELEQAAEVTFDNIVQTVRF